MPRVLTFGAGAIGSIYTYFLHSVGCSVIAVCRSNYAAINSQGFHISTAKLGSDVHVQPPVVHKAAEAAQKSDGSHGVWNYILVSDKAFPGSQPRKPP
jgi:2-dehydropantoate 2-reductase